MVVGVCKVFGVKLKDKTPFATEALHEACSPALIVVTTAVSSPTFALPTGYEGYKQERQMLEAKFEPVKAQYIKIKAESVKVGPEWHDGKNLPLFLFVDEIVVK